VLESLSLRHCTGCKPPLAARWLQKSRCFTQFFASENWPGLVKWPPEHAGEPNFLQILCTSSGGIGPKFPISPMVLAFHISNRSRSTEKTIAAELNRRVASSISAAIASHSCVPPGSEKGRRLMGQQRPGTIAKKVSYRTKARRPRLNNFRASRAQRVGVHRGSASLHLVLWLGDAQFKPGHTPAPRRALRTTQPTSMTGNLPAKSAQPSQVARVDNLHQVDQCSCCRLAFF